MADVVDFTGETVLDIPAEKVLDSAKHLDHVLVLGWDGDDFYCASSKSSINENNLLLDIAKKGFLDALFR